MDWFIDFVWWYCYGFVCFCFCVVLLALLLTFLLQVIKLLTIWSLVVLFCFPNCFRYECLLICFISGSIDLNWDWFINRLIDWIDWLINGSIDWLIDWLFADWLLVLFCSEPCAHERCDPCAFLLALRVFVKLISVMVRFSMLSCAHSFTMLSGSPAISIHMFTCATLLFIGSHLGSCVSLGIWHRRPCARSAFESNRAQESLHVHASWLDVQSTLCTVRPAFMAPEHTRRLQEWWCAATQNLEAEHPPEDVVLVFEKASF